MKYVLFVILMSMSMISYAQSKDQVTTDKSADFIKNAREALATVEAENAKSLKPQLSLSANQELKEGTVGSKTTSTTFMNKETKEAGHRKLKNMNAGDALFEIMYPDKDTAIFKIDSEGGSYFVGSVDVDGASTNKTAYDAGASTMIDFSKSNMAYTSSSPTSFTLEGIKDGGTYTLAVQGDSAGLASFTSTGLTFKSKNNGPTQADTDTLYTFLVFGTTVYYSMISGL